MDLTVHPVRGITAVLAATAVATVVLTACSSGASHRTGSSSNTGTGSTSATSRATVVPISQLPQGWVTQQVQVGGKNTPACLTFLEHLDGLPIMRQGFVQQSESVQFDEYLYAAPSTSAAQTAYTQAAAQLVSCKPSTEPNATSFDPGQLSLAPVGDQSSAEQFTLDDGGGDYVLDVVAFREGAVVGGLIYGDTGDPFPLTSEDLAEEAQLDQLAVEAIAGPGTAAASSASNTANSAANPLPTSASLPPLGSSGAGSASASEPSAAANYVALARAQWVKGASATSALESQFWRTAVSDLQQAQLNGEGSAAADGTAAGQLLQLASLPDANLSSFQEGILHADVSALDTFFGTPTLYR